MATGGARKPGLMNCQEALKLYAGHMLHQKKGGLAKCRPQIIYELKMEATMLAGDIADIVATIAAINRMRGNSIS